MRMHRQIGVGIGLMLALSGVSACAQTIDAPADTSVSSAVSEPSIPEITELNLVRSNFPQAPDTLAVEKEELPPEPTKITDTTTAERLFANSGLTLQWISWEKRGMAWVAVSDEGYWILTGGQQDENGSRFKLEGFITEIGEDYFLMNGTIKIAGAPDADRFCNLTKEGWRFAITQNRSYYRLREFEWCDGLTDYIDIYFER